MQCKENEANKKINESIEPKWPGVEESKEVLSLALVASRVGGMARDE